MSYVDAPLVLTEQVTGALGQTGRLLIVANAGGASTTFMRFEPTQGPALFLKLMPVSRTASLVDAEAVAQWLQQHGVQVVMASGQPLPLNGRMLWVAPFHPGRLAEPTGADMAAIGRGLGRMHRSLSAHPQKARWLQRTDQRLSRLHSVRQALASGTLRAGPEPSQLQEWAKDPSLTFDPSCRDLDELRTPLHGDLNLFNLLMNDGHCVFLDFEDVHHSVLHPVFDLATVYERVVLVHAPTEHREGLLDALLVAYSDATGWRINPTTMPDVLRGLALRALCTLADYDPAGEDETEWRKFFHLMGLSASLSV
jgi:Ser/Thr protein kinase RdoA (MazF antagonist)